MTKNKKQIHWIIFFACLFYARLSTAQQPLEMEYIRPGIDYSEFTGIYIHPLDLSRAKVVPPPWAEDRSPSVWALKPENVAIFQQRYHDVIASEIEKDGKFEVAASPGPGVLEAELTITSITPYSTRDENVMKKGSGKISVQVELTDGANGDLLMLMAGDQEVGEEYKQNSIDTDLENIEALYSVWARRMLDRLKQVPGSAN